MNLSNIIRTLRLWHLARAARFGIVGLTATFIHVGIVISLVETGTVPEPLVANIVAFSCAVLTSYFGHSYWTFQHPKRSMPQFARFLVTSISALALNQLILYFTTRILSLDYRIGLLLVVLLVPIFMFLLARSWVFNSRQ